MPPKDTDASARLGHLENLIRCNHVTVEPQTLAARLGLLFCAVRGKRGGGTTITCFKSSIRSIFCI